LARLEKFLKYASNVLNFERPESVQGPCAYFLPQKYETLYVLSHVLKIFKAFLVLFKINVLVGIQIAILGDIFNQVANLGKMCKKLF